MLFEEAAHLGVGFVDDAVAELGSLWRGSDGVIEAVGVGEERRDIRGGGCVGRKAEKQEHFLGSAEGAHDAEDGGGGGAVFGEHGIDVGVGGDVDEADGGEEAKKDDGEEGEERMMHRPSGGGGGEFSDIHERWLYHEGWGLEKWWEGEMGRGDWVAGGRGWRI